jgi:hypothetical protein
MSTELGRVQLVVQSAGNFSSGRLNVQGIEIPLHVECGRQLWLSDISVI